MAAGTPQPAPRNNGENVPEAFREWAAQHNFPHAVALSEERDAFGRAKYGQPLMTDDGRVTMVDAVQEMGDLLHYVFKARMNREPLDEVAKYLPTLFVLLAPYPEERLDETTGEASIPVVRSLLTQDMEECSLLTPDIS